MQHQSKMIPILRMTSALIAASIVLSVQATSRELSIQPNTDIFTSQLMNREKIINPGVSAYGVPWHCTESEMQEILGPPTGLFIMEDESVIYLYGKSHTFRFRSGRFSDLNITTNQSMINFRMEKTIHENPFFDSGHLDIVPGIKLEMRFPELKSLLQETMQTDLTISASRSSYISKIDYPNGTVHVFWAEFFGYMENTEHHENFSAIAFSITTP
jgi:hypothetical protein